MNNFNTIIFDLGNVLVEWNPRHVFNEDYFESEEKREYFFKNICTDAWNEEQDAGRSIVEATLDLIKKFPGWELWFPVHKLHRPGLFSATPLNLY